MNIRIGSKIVSENIIRYIASIFLITLSFYFYIDREMVALSLLSLLLCLILIYLFDDRRDLFSPKYFFSYLFIFGFCIRPLLLYYNKQGFYNEYWSFSYEEFVEYSSLALIYSHVALFLFVVGYNSFATKYQLKIDLVREVYVNSEFSSLKYAYSLLLLGIVAYILYVNTFNISFIHSIISSVKSV